MRKRPGQQRSQQMVDILLEASGRVIARQGLASLTTNRVAAEAGVSIGSLYQYFANKQELLEGLLERMALDMTRLIDTRMTQLLAADVRTAVKMLLGEMLAFIRGGDGRYLEVVRRLCSYWPTMTRDEFAEVMTADCNYINVPWPDQACTGSVGVWSISACSLAVLASPA